MYSILRLVPVATLSLGLAATAHAQPSSWYASFGAGASIVNDVDINEPGFTGSAELDTGYLVTGAFGAFFDRFRAEGELNYSQSDLDSISVFGLTAPLGGDLTTTSFMVNGYYEFDTGSKWSPYLGGGIGGANVSVNDVSAQGMLLADDDDTVLAYQFKVGVAYRFTDSFDGTFGYRFFATDDPDLSAPDGTSFSLDGPSSHNVEIGVRFRF